MKRFVISMSFFFIPILTIASLMEYFLRLIPNEYTIKQEYLEHHSNEIETLILGNSHTYYGLNPKYFSSKSFNAGNVSQPLYFDLEILQKYINRFSRLKTIIIPVSYFTLYSSNMEGTEGESWRKKNYSIYFDLRRHNDNTIYTEITHNRLNKNFFRLVNHYLYGKSQLNCSDLGWGTSYESSKAQDLINSGIKAADRHTKLNLDSMIYKNNFRENKRLLKDIINYSIGKNIKLIILTLPAYYTYRHKLNNYQLSSTLNLLDKITKKNKNVHYHNLLDDSSFVKEDFYDADHLSEIGAKKLSMKIDSILNNNKKNL